MCCQNAELSDCAGLVPHSTRHSVSPGTISASTDQPNVAISIHTRGFQQICPIPMLLGEPNRFMKRCSGQNDAWGPPMALASVSGPLSAASAASRSAMSSRATSQLTRSHFPLPRSPTRRNGQFTRSGASSAATFMGQRLHAAMTCDP